MEIKEYKNFKEAEIRQLYSEVGWSAYTENMPMVEQGYINSLLVLAAYENDELLGIIRVVGDGFTIVFVQDIFSVSGQAAPRGWNRSAESRY